jgi:hypothetical protein
MAFYRGKRLIGHRASNVTERTIRRRPLRFSYVKTAVAARRCFILAASRASAGRVIRTSHQEDARLQGPWPAKAAP